MGFCIYYRSSEPMHPALAFEINEHAGQLIRQFSWLSCEPVILRQQSDGLLSGCSQPNFAALEFDDEDSSSLPDGTVMTMVEVLCTLSRNHSVDWEIGHDLEPGSIGRICHGVAESDLMEQLETLDSIGDLLEELDDEAPMEFDASEFGWSDCKPVGKIDDNDDDGPRLLKFPVPD